MMTNRQKNRTRQIIRVCMVFFAVLLLTVSVGIPIANNAIALGMEKELKALPLPENTQLVDSTSMAGKLSGNGNGMQYFGAVLIQSTLSEEEIKIHYAKYRDSLDDCLVEPQKGTEIRPGGNPLHNNDGLAFSSPVEGEGYYMIYSWGRAPEWARMWLDIDLRGH